jgi:hypothetical protein
MAFRSLLRIPDKNGSSRKKERSARRIYSVPFHYWIDPARQLVLSSTEEPLSSEDISRFFRDLAADDRFKPDFRQLHDVQDGALTAIRFHDLNALRSSDPFSATSRRAIVVHSNSDYGVARMYQEIYGGNLHVFRSREEAERFLFQ